ncbi:MAG: PQQ-binding-like beta-propeller repeat protein [Planctomycetes bacterium]|nr:PQQ-binding-like beta-propeller repeat protein [Planctomycetota bacterium]
MKSKRLQAGGVEIKFLIFQGELCKIVDVVWRKLFFFKSLSVKFQRHNLTTKAGIYAVIILLFNLTANGQQGKFNWNQFRGPNGQGVAEADSIAVHFSPDSNVLWKTVIGAGQSSPVIWNDRIFLSAYESANRKELVTLSIDREDGKILWRQVIQAETKVRFHPMNSPASASPAADEKHVYVYFGTYGLVCYDHAGKKVWQRKIKPPKSLYGPATSPILYEDKVILVLDDNSGTSRLLAVNRDTGETAWEQPRSLYRAGWSTPMIWRHGDTKELVVLGFKRLTSYNPSNSEEIWWAGGFSQETVGVPVTGEGLLFVSDAAMAGRGEEKWDADLTWKITVERFDKNHDNQIQRDEMTKGFTIPLRPELATDNPGYGLPIFNMDHLLKYIDKDKDQVISQTDWMQTMSGFSMDSRPNLLAIRPGATKDARPSHVVWEIHRGTPETPSILYCRGKLYLIRSGGLLTCIEASTGKEIFRERIGAPGQYVASPIAAGDKLILASARGVVTVIQVDDKLKILARNNFGEKIFATPAIAENKIYLRTTGHLYALGK